MSGVFLVNSGRARELTTEQWSAWARSLGTAYVKRLEAGEIVTFGRMMLWRRL